MSAAYVIMPIGKKESENKVNLYDINGSTLGTIVIADEITDNEIDAIINGTYVE